MGWSPSEHAGSGFSKGHGGVIAALRLPEDEPENACQYDEWQDIPQHLDETE